MGSTKQYQSSNVRNTGPSPTTPPPRRQRISSTRLENPESYRDATKPLLPGWTRQAAGVVDSLTGAPIPYVDGYEGFCYRYDSMLFGPQSGESHYPFPVTEINEMTLPSIPEQTEYLFCDTIKVTLWGYQAGQGNIARLVNSQKEVAGTLKLHNEGFLDQFPSSPSDVSLGVPIDLVAIYKLRCYRRPWNEENNKFVPSLPKHDVYVVLWGEWIDGVAYRRACGEVLADAWDGLPHKNVSLVLG